MSSGDADSATTIPTEQTGVGRLLGLIEPLLGWSFGQVDGSGSPRRLAKPCLQHCLNGPADALCAGACAWLKTMISDGQVPPIPPGGRCEKGFEIHVSPGKGTAEAGCIYALRDQGPGTPGSQGFSPEQALQRWNTLLDQLERIAGELERREEENVRLVEEVLQSYEQLNILFEVTKSSITMTRAEEVYDFALARLSESLRARFACFLDTEGTFSRTISQFEQKEDQYRIYRGLIANAHKDIAQAARSSEAKAMIVSDDEAGDNEIEARSLLIVPLRSGEEVLGAALFGRSPTDPFRTGEKSMAEAVMGQVAHTAHKLRLFQDLHQMSIDVVSALVNAIDAKDKYTYGHSERVSQWSVLLGEELNFESDDLQMLAWAGHLHDVGKIGIRDDVLGKPGKLTKEEFDHIKEHPAISYEVLKPIRRLAPVLDGVRHHHEGWDGSGYPDGLAGEEVPLAARIIQIADVFDALTTSRSYRGAYSMEEALEIMKNDAGKRLDPKMVELFLKVLERVKREHPNLLAHVQSGVSKPAVQEGEMQE